MAHTLQTALKLTFQLLMTSVLVISIVYCTETVSVCWWITLLLVAGQLKKQRMDQNKTEWKWNRICAKSCISRDNLELTVTVFTNTTRDH